MTQTQILARMAKARSSQAAQDVQDAMHFFNNDLAHPDADSYFTYKKLGHIVLLTKPADISKRWRALLTNNPVIALRWALIRDAECAQNTAALVSINA